MPYPRMNDFADYRHGADGLAKLMMDGVQVWPSSGPIGVYRIYATGTQVVPAGNNLPVDLDAGSETSTGTIDVAYEPLPWDAFTYAVTLHDAGTYYARAHVDLGRATANQASMSGFDFGSLSWGTNAQGPGDPIELTSEMAGPSGSGFGLPDDTGMFVVGSPDGFVFLNVGNGASQPDLAIQVGTYVEIERWA